MREIRMEEPAQPLVLPSRRWLVSKQVASLTTPLPSLSSPSLPHVSTQTGAHFSLDVSRKDKGPPALSTFPFTPADVKLERESVPFEEQLQAVEVLIK